MESVLTPSDCADSSYECHSNSVSQTEFEFPHAMPVCEEGRGKDWMVIYAVQWVSVLEQA